MESQTRAAVHDLFYPDGVAVVGSTAEGKIGYQLIRQIVDGGFARVYAVNPKAQGAFGVPAFTAVSEVGERVGLAVIASPAATVAPVLEDCGRAGVGAAVVISSGFSEVGNKAAEDEIRRIGCRYGMAIVGPNCAGIVNTHHKLFASIETRPPSGPVGFISQSGALGGAVLSWAEEQGIGISKFLSYGNRVDVDEMQLLPYLAEDPETKVVALYIESVAAGRPFLNAVREFTRHKPLVVIKSGKSQSGQRATLSHTGSMAGADAVYDAALRSCGAIRVAGVEEMFDLCKAFANLPRVKGRRVAIVTNSGGPGVLAADRAEEVGLDVSEPSAPLVARLRRLASDHCSFRNPIDLTVEGTEAGYRETLLAVLDEYDAAVAIDVSTPHMDTVALARGVSDAAERVSKPVVVSFMAGRAVADALVYLKDRNVPNYATGERAVAVLAHMADYEARRSRCLEALPPVQEEQRSLPSGGRMLEPDAMRWLEENGIAIPPFRFAKDVVACAQACREIGYPVVIKVVSPQIVHKSEFGGVALGICNEAAAVMAFDTIRRASEGRDFRGVVVYPMLRGGCEVLVGITRDPQFGPVVAFGVGGIHTEILRDISLRVAPVDRLEAEAMIHEIRSFPILAGARGKPPCDLSALADVIATVSRLPFVYPEIAEIDLNPVFVFEKGLFVGDVRVIGLGHPEQGSGETI
ncbi:MAG: acetate--CoA ligase family protein [Vicinamibacterales bacterium]